MKTTMVWTGSLILLISLSACTNMPLRRPQSEIQTWVLEKTPIGSSEEHARAMIAGNRWNLNLDWKGTNNTFTEIRGAQIIGAYLGGYQGLPWYVDVDAFWGFDEDGKLIDLQVRKYFDAP